MSGRENVCVCVQGVNGDERGLMKEDVASASRSLLLLI